MSTSGRVLVEFKRSSVFYPLDQLDSRDVAILATARRWRSVKIGGDLHPVFSTLPGRPRRAVEA